MTERGLASTYCAWSEVTWSYEARAARDDDINIEDIDDEDSDDDDAAVESREGKKKKKKLIMMLNNGNDRP